MEIRTTWIDVDVKDGTKMRLWAAEPVPQEGVTIKKGVIVLQEAFGVNAHIRDVTERFAKEGYVAVAPELYHRTGAGFEGSYTDYPAIKPHMEALSNEGLLADIAASREFLLQCKVEKIGVIGFCMGGRSAFLANASMPLDVAISFYGGGIAPNAQMNNPGLLDKAKDTSAPMLFFWGGKDGHILAEHRAAVANAMHEAGKVFGEINFDFADHGFFCDAREAYNPEAAALAWPMVLGFLKRHLE